MNLILFDSAEISVPLPRTDRRALHLLDVLRRQPGDSIDVGLINGPRGKATVDAISAEEIKLVFAWKETVPPQHSLLLLVGLPRPQTARDILREATTLGVDAIHFVQTGKTEAGYAQSTLWSSGEWRRHLIAGAEQAFQTRIPTVTHATSLNDALSRLDPTTHRIALDNYEASLRLGEVATHDDRPQVVAIGGERGWSADDRATLRSHHFVLAHLGDRVLRTETAVVAALSILRMKRGLM